MENKDLQIVLDYLNKTLVTNVTVYELASISPFYDYSIICDASNMRLAKSTIDKLRDEAIIKKLDVISYSKEKESNWFYIDLNSVIVHIFLNNARKEFNLDGLYYDLPRKEY